MWFSKWFKRRIMYAGWISGEPEDRRKLRRLGIHGPMRYSRDCKAFQQCLLTPRKMQRLIDKGVLPNPGSWTAYWVDTDENLPRERQLGIAGKVQL